MHLQILQWNQCLHFPLQSLDSGDKALIKRRHKVKTGVWEKIETCFTTGHNTESCKNTGICLEYKLINIRLHKSESLDDTKLSKDLVKSLKILPNLETTVKNSYSAV